MKTEVACVSAALIIFAASVTACGDDDYVPDEPVVDTDASVPPVADAAVDANATDAQSDAGQAPLEQCTACIFGDCGSALISCVTDPACRDLASCVITTGCITNLPSCIPQCLGDSELSTGELLNALALLQTLATSCTTCFATCQSALPGGGDGGLGDFGGFGGSGGFGGF